jgi:hypothetical protein
VTVTWCLCVTEVNAIMLSLYFRIQVNTLLPCLNLLPRQSDFTHLVADRHSPVNDTINYPLVTQYVVG